MSPKPSAHSIKPMDAAYTSTVYVPPQGTFSYFVWRARIKFEATWGLAVLEPWEKAMVVTFLMAFYALVLVYTIFYLPQRLSLLHARAIYYLFGSHHSASAGTTVFALGAASGAASGPWHLAKASNGSA